MTPELESVALMAGGGFPQIIFILLAIVANVFPAIPEEIFLLGFGYFIHKDPAVQSFWGITAFLIVGFLTADSILYYLAYKGNKYVKWLAKKILHYDLEEPDNFINKNINKTIFISRFLVQLRSLGPIIAGTVKYPYKKFLMMDFLALAIYTPGVMGIGYYYTNRIEKIISGANVVSNIMLNAFILIIIIVLLIRLRKVFMRTMMQTFDTIGSGIKNGIKTTNNILKDNNPPEGGEQI
jgi:membrane protein DedA with SNARE-associated domain